MKTLFQVAMAAAVANLVRLPRLGEAAVGEQETAGVALLATRFAVVTGIGDLSRRLVGRSAPGGRTIAGRSWAAVLAA